MIFSFAIVNSDFVVGEASSRVHGRIHGYNGLRGLSSDDEHLQSDGQRVRCPILLNYGGFLVGIAAAYGSELPAKGT